MVLIVVALEDRDLERRRYSEGRDPPVSLGLYCSPDLDVDELKRGLVVNNEVSGFPRLHSIL